MVQLGTSFHPCVVASLIIDHGSLRCKTAVQPGTRGCFGASARPAASITLVPVHKAPHDYRSIINIQDYQQKGRDLIHSQKQLPLIYETHGLLFPALIMNPILKEI